MSLKGSCGCENVKYTIKDKPLFTQACHCKDCKKSTGSSFVIHTMVLEKDLEVKGDVASIELVNDISPPQPVLADLFELDTTAVHAVVSFHFTTTHQPLFAHVMWFPGEQDDHH